MNKELNELTEEQFNEVCMEAGVTTDELFVEDGHEYITWEDVFRKRLISLRSSNELLGYEFKLIDIQYLAEVSGMNGSVM